MIFPPSIQLKDGDATTQGLDLIQDAGFGMVRRGIYWSRVEIVKGVYDFRLYDNLFAEATARGLWISATLFSNNSLYEGVTTEAGRKGFANFAAAAVAHCKGKKVIWEIWNEPNIASFWHAPSNSDAIADEYTALVKAVVPAMRKADRASYIVAGSISALWSQSFTWFDRCVRQGLLSSGINGVSVHPYGFPWPERAVEGYAAIRSRMNAVAANALSIVNTEVGYPLDWIQERQGFAADEAPEVQGWLLVRQRLVDLMNGIKYSNWYDFRGDQSFAMVSPEYVPFPAFNAAKVLSQQLGGFTFKKRLPTASKLDYAVLFRNSAGVQKLAAWTTSDMADPVASRRPHPHAIDVAVSGSAQLAYVDVNGAAGALQIVKGKASVPLDGGPKYLTLLG